MGDDRIPDKIIDAFGEAVVQWQRSAEEAVVILDEGLLRIGTVCDLVLSRIDTA